MKIAVESRFKQAGVFVCHGAPYYATLVTLAGTSQHNTPEVLH